MEMDRRLFMYRAAEVLAGVALSGCASAAVTRVAATGGAVRLRPSDYPALGQPNGYIRVQPEGTTSALYVLAPVDGQYVVLSPICTHLGCTVNLEGDRLVCPCHGSTYDRTGQVLRGPAEQPLRRLPAELGAGGELVIQLEETL